MAHFFDPARITAPPLADVTDGNPGKTWMVAAKTAARRFETCETGLIQVIGPVESLLGDHIHGPSASAFELRIKPILHGDPWTDLRPLCRARPGTLLLWYPLHGRTWCLTSSVPADTPSPQVAPSVLRHRGHRE